jgi:YhcH/YjgK/YiaL family protein
MIADLLTNGHLYRSIHPRLAAALEGIAAFDLSRPDGRYEIDGDRIFLLVQSYETAKTPTKRWESHRRYFDVQCIVGGHEVIHYRHVTSLNDPQPYNETKDVIHYASAEGEPGVVCLRPGEFGLFLPEDGHWPGGSIGETGTVRKVVAKVEL